MFRGWWRNFLNLIYPLHCLICQAKINPASDKPVCADCWKKIEFIAPPFCRRCGKHLPAESQEQAFICNDCQKLNYSFRQARAVCVYEGVIKECIHLFKYKSKLALAKPLSRLMINFADQFLNLQSIDIIVPVPLHKAKQRQRQFNQAQLLALGLSEVFAKDLESRALVKIKPGRPQVELARAERIHNLRGSFKVKVARLVKNKNLLLVDDVFTTGATANECAKALLEAGANRVEVITLART